MNGIIICIGQRSEFRESTFLSVSLIEKYIIPNINCLLMFDRKIILTIKYVRVTSQMPRI